MVNLLKKYKREERSFKSIELGVVVRHDHWKEGQIDYFVLGNFFLKAFKSDGIDDWMDVDTKISSERKHNHTYLIDPKTNSGRGDEHMI